MTKTLEDIIDLDFLLSLDEDSATGADPDHTAERDREIYKDINDPDLDDTGLILRWVAYRRLLFAHEKGNRELLPGRIYASLYRWSARGVTAAGFVLGIFMAYAFLAYHGSQPVNVTVFITFFILFQGMLSLTAFGVMLHRMYTNRTGRSRPPAVQTFLASIFHQRLNRLAERAADLPGGGHLRSLGEKGAFLNMKNKEYNGIFFWPFFCLTSLFALGFSSGAFCGTLFRVAVTDLAFGWQSTLFTSGAQIHTFVSWLALPWSWIMPEALSAPSLAEIEGSRILLKEGIAGLATAHLVAWWPFLCMGILVYGVLARAGLVVAGNRAQKRALARFDFSRPKFRRLAARMRSPRMEVTTRDTGGSEAFPRSPLPVPEFGTRSSDTRARDNAESAESITPAIENNTAVAALVLASARVYPESDLPPVWETLKTQLRITPEDIVHVVFDINEDGDLLREKAGNHTARGPVVVLQEVWQPPIRGLLLYFRELKTQVFPDRPIWIFLTQTPGEKEMGVAADDPNFQVWKTAVAQLKDPEIIVERWNP